LKFKFNSMSLFRTPVQKFAQAGALALKVPRFRSKNDFGHWLYAPDLKATQPLHYQV